MKKYTIKRVDEAVDRLRPKVDAFKQLARDTASQIKQDLKADDKTAAELTQIALGVSKDDTNEASDTSSPTTVTFISKRKGDGPFNIGGKQYEIVNGLYPDNEVRAAVYSYADDKTYDRNWFRQNIAPGDDLIGSELRLESIMGKRIMKVSDIRK